MKHLSLWLTVILLGAMPLAAAAFDYGPNQPLLAADSSVPQLPGTQVHAVTAAELPAPDVIAANGSDAGAGATDGTPRARALPSPESTPTHRHVPVVRNRSHEPPSSAKPEPVPTQATWQSLLPGSIQ